MNPILTKHLDRWFELTIKQETTPKKQWKIIECVYSKLIQWPIVFCFRFYKKMSLHEGKMVSDYSVILKIYYPIEYIGRMHYFKNFALEKLDGDMLTEKWSLSFWYNQIELQIKMDNFQLLLETFKKIYENIEIMLNYTFSQR